MKDSGLGPGSTSSSALGNYHVLMGKFFAFVKSFDVVGCVAITVVLLSDCYCSLKTLSNAITEGSSMHYTESDSVIPEVTPRAL